MVFVSETVNFLLSFRRLTRVSDVQLYFFKDIFVPLFCVTGANLFKNLVFSVIKTDSLKLAASAETVTAVVLYTAMIIAFHSIDREELRWLRSLVK